jgi:hypothetical protein
MLCSLCGKGCRLTEWVRLKKVFYLGKGKEVVKGKIYAGKFAYSEWKIFCRECSLKIQGFKK